MLFPYLLTPKTEFIYWYAVETMIMDTLIKDTMQGHLHLNDISTNPKMHYIYIYLYYITRLHIVHNGHLFLFLIDFIWHAKGHSH